MKDLLNKVTQGDCLQVMKQIPDNSIDLVVTSPPYWKGFEYEAYFNSYAQYLRWSERWLKEVKRILKPNGNFFLNVINDSEVTTRAFELLNIATEDLMYKLHETIIWYRYNQQPANTDRQLTNQTEFVFLLRNTSAGIKLNKELPSEYLKYFKTKNIGNVWEIPFNSTKTDFGRKETKSKWGHSGFPEALSDICILLTTKESDVVLDCFLGSGTTCASAKKLNRNFIGIELSPDYCKIAEERIKAVPRRLTEFIQD